MQAGEDPPPRQVHLPVLPPPTLQALPPPPQRPRKAAQTEV
jgi:hypothetical protein